MLLNTPEAELGWIAPPFSLSDPSGKRFTFDSLKGENGSLVAFICNHCPYVQAIIERFVGDANTLRQIARTGIGPAEQHPSIGCSIKWS